MMNLEREGVFEGMNKEKQRIAIAEFCGWKNPDYPHKAVFDMWYHPHTYDGAPDSGMGMLYTHELPDYTEDLNVMVPAVRQWIGKRTDRLRSYSDTLKNVIQDHCPELAQQGAVECRYATAIAGAGLHCEALLKVIGKWEEE
jgi:hypothetical protein